MRTNVPPLLGSFSYLYPHQSRNNKKNQMKFNQKKLTKLKENEKKKETHHIFG